MLAALLQHDLGPLADRADGAKPAIEQPHQLAVVLHRHRHHRRPDPLRFHYVNEVVRDPRGSSIVAVRTSTGRRSTMHPAAEALARGQPALGGSARCGPRELPRMAKFAGVLAHGHRHQRQPQQPVQVQRCALGERRRIEEPDQRLAQVREPLQVVGVYANSMSACVAAALPREVSHGRTALRYRMASSLSQPRIRHRVDGCLCAEPGSRPWGTGRSRRRASHRRGRPAAVLASSHCLPTMLIPDGHSVAVGDRDGQVRDCR